MLPRLSSLKVRAGERVLLRVDWNVPLNGRGSIDRAEVYKIERTLPTLRLLKKKGVVTVIVTHVGRPEGTVMPKFSTKPLATYVRRTMALPMRYSPHPIGSPELVYDIERAKPGEAILLENIRFYPEEEKNDEQFARSLAQLAQYYVNDAFAASHRAHASVARITTFLPSVAGLLFEQELRALGSLLSHRPHRPYVVILGGTKISTKLGLIKKLCTLADAIFVGGGIANTLLYCRSQAVGKSLCERLSPADCRKLLTAREWKKILLPVDAVMARSLDASRGRLTPLSRISSADMIGDIGPATITMLTPVIRRARTVVWNGPVGYFENPAFSSGSHQIARLVTSSLSYTVAGGGETIQLIRGLHMEKKFSFLSTGGGAMLEFLEGKKLPGVEALRLRR